MLYRRSSRINRNIVECKEMPHTRITASRTTVLIETLWNVKYCEKREGMLYLSINRNIVECKAVGIYQQFNSELVLIETLWNVKPHSISVGWIFLSY